METSKAKHMSAKKDFTHVYENHTPVFYYQEVSCKNLIVLFSKNFTEESAKILQLQSVKL